MPWSVCLSCTLLFVSTMPRPPLFTSLPDSRHFSDCQKLVSENPHNWADVADVISSASINHLARLISFSFHMTTKCISWFFFFLEKFATSFKLFPFLYTEEWFFFLFTKWFYKVNVFRKCCSYGYICVHVPNKQAKDKNKTIKRSFENVKMPPNSKDESWDQKWQGTVESRETLESKPHFLICEITFCLFLWSQWGLKHKAHSECGCLEFKAISSRQGRDWSCAE